MVFAVFLVVGLVLLAAFAIGVRREQRAERRHVQDDHLSPLAVLSQPLAHETSSGSARQGALLGGGTALLLAGLVLLVGRSPAAPQPSRDEVIRLARDTYGLVVTEPGAPKPAQQAGTAAPPASPSGRVTVVIASGDAAPAVADKLVSAGVISDRAAFLSHLSTRGLDGAIKAGSFSLAPGADVDTVINTLTA